MSNKIPNTYDDIQLGMKVNSRKWIDQTTMCHYDGYWKNTFSEIKRIDTIQQLNKEEYKILYPKKGEKVKVSKETFNSELFIEKVSENEKIDSSLDNALLIFESTENEN